MSVISMSALGRRFVVAGITGYQRYISPYKGFCCAHRALHGGDSCSHYIKRCVQEMNWRDAYWASRRRLRECKEASITLRAAWRRNPRPKQTVYVQRPGAPPNPACDCMAQWCACEMMDCGSQLACDACMSGACDAGSCIPW